MNGLSRVLMLALLSGVGWYSISFAELFGDTVCQDDRQERLEAVLERTEALRQEVITGESAASVEERRARTAECVEELIGNWGEGPGDNRRRGPLFFLARYADDLVDPTTSSRAYEWLLEDLLRSVPETHDTIQDIRSRLALSLELVNEFEKALELRDEIIAVYVMALECDDPRLFRARFDRIALLATVGVPEDAREEYIALIEELEKLVPPDDMLLLEVRIALAATTGRLGYIADAVAIEEKAIALLEAQESPDENLLDTARINLASHLGSLGRLDRARELEEALLTKYTPLLPEEHGAIVRLRINHAATLRDLGDYAGAAVLFDRVLAITESAYPASHPLLQAARLASAASHAELGDFVVAQALVETAVSILEAERPATDSLLTRARQTLVGILRSRGEWGQALPLLEELDSRYAQSGISADDPGRLEAKLFLADCRRQLGQLEEAVELGERLLADCEEHLAEAHPMHLRAEAGLAVSLIRAGRLEDASQLEQQALARLDGRYPSDHPIRLRLLARHAWTLSLLGKPEESRTVLEELVDGVRVWIDSALLRSPREASGAAVEVSRNLAVLLSVRRSGEEWQHLSREAFELIVNTRSLHGLGAGLGGGKQADDRVKALRDRVLEYRTRIADLGAAQRSGENDRHSEMEDVTAAILDRDRAEGELRALLVERGLLPPRLEVESLAGVLAEDAVAVSFLSYHRWVREEENEQWLLAHVLSSSGDLQTVDLGPESEMLALIQCWREAIGAPLSGERPRKPGSKTAAREAGHALRARVLDPVLEVAGEARVLHICLDGPLHLLPFEALPSGGGVRAVVGDRLEFRFHHSLAGLLEPRRPRRGEATFLAVGAVDFDAAPAAGLNRGPAPFAIPIPVSVRSEAAVGFFPPLIWTGPEISYLGDLFEAALGQQAVQLEGSAATKASFHDLAPHSRYLHVATHGYFARAASVSAVERFLGVLDPRFDLDTAIRGMAPMSLCGLALAGANRGVDEFGRVPGIITAEEIAGLDLSACELAVLSACETGVGERLPGLGIASLQTALHAAGARNTITALWKVHDRYARQLMGELYGRVWREERAPAQTALWEAKCALREEGVDLRDWAAWVLTGVGSRERSGG
jgi:CHAT domain-containing protein/tetratricopeptide (TPR) repeat protein